MLQQQHSELDDRLITEVVDGHSHEGADLMRDRLFQLQIQEKELLAKFKPSHPEVRIVRDQLQQARAVFTSQPDDRQQIKKAVNPTKMTLHGTLLNAIAELQGIQAQMDALTTKREAITERLRVLNENEAKLATLTRELEVARMNHRTYAEKLEEARINRELDRDRISNVKIVQAPTLTLKPVSPKRLLILLCASVVALGASLVFAQVLEASDSSLHSSQDLAQQLNVPVLAELPRTSAKKVMPH